MDEEKLFLHINNYYCLLYKEENLAQRIPVLENFVMEHQTPTVRGHANCYTYSSSVVFGIWKS